MANCFFSFFFFIFFILIVLLDVSVRCGDHAPFYNLFNVTLKNLGMFNINSFCHLHSYSAHCFYPIVEFFVLRKQKRNKLPTTNIILDTLDSCSIGKHLIISLVLNTASINTAIHKGVTVCLCRNHFLGFFVR